MAVIAGNTLNDAALLATLLAATMTVVVPTGISGTFTTIWVSLHEFVEPTTPPNVTVPEDVKPEPLIVTGRPTGAAVPSEGEMLLIVGADCANANAANVESVTKARMSLADFCMR